jgi:hypothetical protein
MTNIISETVLWLLPYAFVVQTGATLLFITLLFTHVYALNFKVYSAYSCGNGKP